MKNLIILGALVSLSACALKPTVPELRQDSENIVSVHAFADKPEGTSMHLHQDVCHSSKNATGTKTFKKCDKLRLAEGVIVDKTADGFVRIKLDKPVQISNDMFFEENGTPMKAY